MKALLRKIGGASVEGELISMPEEGSALRLVSGAEGNFNIYSTSTVEFMEKLAEGVFALKTRNSKYVLYILSEAALLREV